jgi:hypothetical protein
MNNRSPIIFWLLLAATIGVDAVAMSSSSLNTSYLIVSALVLSQLSVVCIWLALTAPRTVVLRVTPFFAVLFAAVLSAEFSAGLEPFGEYFQFTLTYYGFHAALLMAALWLLQRTAFWQRSGGAIREWKYSVADLLIAMTVVALLAALMRDSPLLGEFGWMNFQLAGGGVVLALVSVVAWSRSWHWLLRLAVVVGCAILLGAAFLVIPIVSWFYFVFVGTDYLIQALVLSIWLALGPILPVFGESDPDHA